MTSAETCTRFAQTSLWSFNIWNKHKYIVFRQVRNHMAISNITDHLEVLLLIWILLCKYCFLYFCSLQKIKKMLSPFLVCSSCLPICSLGKVNLCPTTRRAIYCRNMYIRCCFYILPQLLFINFPKGIRI